ncbi:hypothetical protein AVEN_75891-1 [Araneus ventricosus]|uniref:Uncharacterized protein n=1 Tax=Araneus ventricosus TaxID=182803 RepID=A0A4Y2FUF2_ARAVE|nr:hypothetical protein AVEN_75891-1 [Araneus ventricosus]
MEELQFPSSDRNSYKFQDKLCLKLCLSTSNTRNCATDRLKKLLSEEHKKKRLASALTFLFLYNKESIDFLSHIITGDETWVMPLQPSEDLPV